MDRVQQQAYDLAVMADMPNDADAILTGLVNCEAYIEKFKRVYGDVITCGIPKTHKNKTLLTTNKKD